MHEFCTSPQRSLREESATNSSGVMEASATAARACCYLEPQQKPRPRFLGLWESKGSESVSMLCGLGARHMGTSHTTSDVSSHVVSTGDFLYPML